jgi:RHS repeat-associated protein
MTKGPLSGGMADFMFDSRNRLIQAGDTVYRYDAENQRIGVNQIQYVVNSQPALSQVLVKEENGQKTFYVYGLIGQEQGGEYLTYHFDLRGSTVALTDEIGIVTERFQYLPYGLLMNGSASITPFLFNGMYGVITDSNGLYYMRVRYYSPDILRFVNQDIIQGFIGKGQTLNRFVFVNGNPIIAVDPKGEWLLNIAVGITAWFALEVLIQPDLPPGLENDAIVPTTFPDLGISAVIAGSKLTTKICSSQFSQKFKDWLRSGIENDGMWKNTTLREKFFYELGQKTFKGDKYKKYEQFTNPIERGRKIFEDHPWAWATVAHDLKAWKIT